MAETLGVQVRRSFPLPAEPSVGHSGVPWALACSPRLPFGTPHQGNRLVLRWSNQNLSFLRVTLGRESFDAVKCHKPEKTDTSASVSPPSCLTLWDEDPPLPHITLLPRIPSFIHIDSCYRCSEGTTASSETLETLQTQS